MYIIVVWKSIFKYFHIFLFSLSPPSEPWMARRRKRRRRRDCFKISQTCTVDSYEKKPKASSFGGWTVHITHPTKLWNDNFYLRKRERNQLLIMILNIFIFHNMIFTTINNHINIVSLSSAFVEICANHQIDFTHALYFPHPIQQLPKQFSLVLWATHA